VRISNARSEIRNARRWTESVRKRQMSENLSAEGSGLLGLYRTPEGRVVLRGLSQTLAAKLGGQANLAARMVDPKSPANFDEVERIRKALFRTDRKLQRELSREPRENIPLHARLEHALLADGDFRMILEDHMHASRRQDVVDGLTAFFCGNDTESIKSYIEVTQDEICGLYSSVITTESDDGQSGTMYYDRMHYFHYVPDRPHLIAHEFQFRDRHKGKPYLANRRSGFAFPLPSGPIHRLMANYENPSERTYDLIFPMAKADIERWRGRPRGDRFFRVNRHILHQAPEVTQRLYNGRHYHIRSSMVIVSPSWEDESEKIISDLIKVIVGDVII
jgi:hypothetical protein